MRSHGIRQRKKRERMDFVYLIAGLALLVLAGDALVRGAVALSLRLGIPALIVSATVVAFGTSAPELLVAVQAALDGAPGIAYGNVVGSNIANVLLVLGLPAIFAPIAACGPDGRRNLYFMLGATTLFIVLCLCGAIEWWGGLLLVGFSMLMVWDSIGQARISMSAGETAEDLAELEDVDPQMAPWKIAALVVAGVVGLPVGAGLLIDGATSIARDFGVSEAAIGLTLVAVGTSLPELATAVMAAVRKQADVVMGNVIGSNIFNLTAIFGAAALVAPMPVPEEIANRDIWVMLACSLIVVPYVLFCRRICRLTGAAFMAVYGAYVFFALA